MCEYSCPWCDGGLVIKKCGQDTTHWFRKEVCGNCKRLSVQDLVKQFHEKFGVPVLAQPAVPSSKRCLLRVNLIKEEFEELDLAAGNGDLVEVADALADIAYVVYGAAHEYGIDLDWVIHEVHRTNMLKEGGTTRADGKILKPEGWEPPRIGQVLREQGWYPECVCGAPAEDDGTVIVEHLKGCPNE